MTVAFVGYYHNCMLILSFYCLLLWSTVIASRYNISLLKSFCVNSIMKFVNVNIYEAQIFKGKQVFSEASNLCNSVKFDMCKFKRIVIFVFCSSSSSFQYAPTFKWKYHSKNHEVYQLLFKNFTILVCIRI